jgi:hypothetical protein
MMNKTQNLLTELKEVWYGAGTFSYEEKDDKIFVELSTNMKVRSDNSKGAGDILTRALVTAEEYSIYERCGCVIIELIFSNTKRRIK